MLSDVLNHVRRLGMTMTCIYFLLIRRRKMREELTGAGISTVVLDVKLNIVKQNETNSQPIIFDVVIFKACITCIILTMVKCFDIVMHLYDD